MTTREIAAMVAEIEANTAAVRARAQARAAAVVVEEIQPGLGRLTVTSFGELTSIEFDTRAVKRTTADALADAVVAAVQRAERRAADPHWQPEPEDGEDEDHV